jgi:hypothetical protein
MGKFLHIAFLFGCLVFLTKLTIDAIILGVALIFVLQKDKLEEND